MQFDITTHQLEYLAALLERDQHLLELEICRTDHREFKEMLRERQRLCEQLLDKVARQTARSTA